MTVVLYHSGFLLVVLFINCALMQKLATNSELMSIYVIRYNVVIGIDIVRVILYLEEIKELQQNTYTEIFLSDFEYFLSFIYAVFCVQF